jgi:hypothetical protein
MFNKRMFSDLILLEFRYIHDRRLLAHCQTSFSHIHRHKADIRDRQLIVQTIRNKKAILQEGELRDALAKYQVMLDNELYKAIKALRETQNWRLGALNGFVLEK